MNKSESSRVVRRLALAPRLLKQPNANKSVPKEEMEPFYFGSSGKPLFGCYHVPESEPARGCGVVLCPPMGYEYILAHGAYRQLAIRLSNAGFPVLRFDFYGCGDSGGSCEEGGICQWLADISAAIGEIRRRCKVGQLCLFGARLGGSLSTMVGAERGDIDGLVLLDPIVSGRAYIAELIARHRDMLRYSHVKQNRGARGEKPAEILGFPLADPMLGDLEDLDLLAIRQKPANNILLIESCEAADRGRWREHIKNTGALLEYRYLPGPDIWMWEEDFSNVLVPYKILLRVVSWISKVYP